MDNVYANPVGIDKKDIYIITNKINGKQYIGQSKNPESRFIAHCKKTKSNSSMLNKDIQAYGKDNFEIRILEKHVPNYDEREKYWIKTYNTIYPNGYNILEGGSNPPKSYGTSHPNSKLSEEDLSGIVYELENTKLSYSDIANKYNTNKKTVSSINNGLSYFDENTKYPIRKEPNTQGLLSDEQVDEIIHTLKYSYTQYGEIARKYGVKISSIKYINSGATHHRDNESYPIRKYKNSGRPVLTYEQVTEIIELLKTTNISMRKIAKMYNLSQHGEIVIINNGSSLRYRRDNEEYPIRKP